MTYRCYVAKDFNDEHMSLIRLANEIITDHEAQGLTMTLRQLYYQFVVRNAIQNKQSEYKRLGKILSEARLAGLVSWTALEDRQRQLMGHRTFNGPSEALRRARDGYRIDMWSNQPFRPEVWVEKAALEGVVGDICFRLRINFFACRGYNSQSEQWRAGRRFSNYIQKGQTPIVFHFGDHDPSGLDMTRDNRTRLSMFSGVPITVVRLALNIGQIEELKLPPNPAKMSDSRAPEYVSEFGEASWELDALDPSYIWKLIEDNIMQIRDQNRWDEMAEQEVDDKRLLEDMVEQIDGGTDDDEQVDDDPTE